MTDTSDENMAQIERMQGVVPPSVRSDLLAKVAELEAELTDARYQDSIGSMKIASDRIAKLEQREQLWQDYNDFVREANAGAYLLAHLHGWNASEEEMRIGRGFRDKLGILIDGEQEK